MGEHFPTFFFFFSNLFPPSPTCSGKLTTYLPRDLPAALARVTERIVQGTLDALPPYSPPPFPVPAAAERVALFDWMVLTCYPEELRRQQHLADLAAAERDVLREVAAQQQANGNLDQLPAAGTEQGDYRGLRLD